MLIENARLFADTLSLAIREINESFDCAEEAFHEATVAVLSAEADPSIDDAQMEKLYEINDRCADMVGELREKSRKMEKANKLMKELMWILEDL